MRSNQFQRLLVVYWLPLALLACDNKNSGAAASSGCASDIDCKGDRICSDGICVSPYSAGGTHGSGTGGAGNSSTGITTGTIAGAAIAIGGSAPSGGIAAGGISTGGSAPSGGIAAGGIVGTSASAGENASGTTSAAGSTAGSGGTASGTVGGTAGGVVAGGGPFTGVGGTSSCVADTGAEVCKIAKPFEQVAKKVSDPWKKTKNSFSVRFAGEKLVELDGKCCKLDPTKPTGDFGSWPCTDGYSCGGCLVFVIDEKPSDPNNAYDIFGAAFGLDNETAGCPDYSGGYSVCVPNCDGKICGSDGCNGSCGACSGTYSECNAEGTACVVDVCSQCIGNCTSACAGGFTCLQSCCTGTGCMCSGAC